MTDAHPSEKIETKGFVKRFMVQIAIIMLIIWVSGRVFGMYGVISVISLLFLYRFIKIFTKGEKILKNILNFIGSIIYVAAIIFSSWQRDWLGLWGLIVIFIFLLSFRLYHLFSKWEFMTQLMKQQARIWQKMQVGYALDDPYWDTHKRPTKLELIRGSYVPQKLKEKK